MANSCLLQDWFLTLEYYCLLCIIVNSTVGNILMQEILLQHRLQEKCEGSYLTRTCICIFYTANACYLKFLLFSCRWRTRCLSLNSFIEIASFLLRCLHIQSELFIFFTLRFHIDKQFRMECPRPLVIKKINCSLVTTSHNRTSSFFIFGFFSSIHQSCFFWAYQQILSRYRKKNNKVY